MLKKLTLVDFRNIEHVDLTFSEGINLISGDNGSGKTSILEAIYLLTRARSFRTRHWRQMLRKGQTDLGIRARIDKGETDYELRLKRGKSENRLSLNGQTVTSPSEVIGIMPTMYLGPQVSSIVSGKPEIRRRWLDFTLFHVKHEIRPLWGLYARALRQRNAALRAGSSDRVLEGIDAQLSVHGEKLHSLRASLLNSLVEGLPRELLTTFSLEGVHLDYRSGWKSGEELLQSLRSSLASDRRHGFTHVGPHRADVVIKTDQVRVKEWLSRGQEKLLAISLFMAQAECIRTYGESSPCVLVDDLGAELDQGRQEIIRNWLITAGIQVIVTSLPSDEENWAQASRRMFHVEQGKCQPVV